MSISKQATQLAYWLQESHKPFLSPGVIDLGCLKSISALYILSVFCPSSVEQAFARVSFKPSCEGGERQRWISDAGRGPASELFLGQLSSHQEHPSDPNYECPLCPRAQEVSSQGPSGTDFPYLTVISPHRRPWPCACLQQYHREPYINRLCQLEYGTHNAFQINILLFLKQVNSAFSCSSLNTTNSSE